MSLQGTGILSLLLQAVGLVVLILVSLSIHEFAHALVAHLYGDPTAKLLGRLSLNPLRHWDPIGTTLLVVLVVANVFGIPVPVIGWGKPVPVDERNFDNPIIDGIQTALAGPMSNFILAALLAALLHISGIPDWLNSFLSLGVYLNLFLMFFNLLPVPPLDGSRLLRLFLPERTYFSLISNPVLYFGLIIVVFYFLIDYVAYLANHLAMFLINI